MTQSLEINRQRNNAASPSNMNVTKDSSPSLWRGQSIQNMKVIPTDIRKKSVRKLNL